MKNQRQQSGFGLLVVLTVTLTFAIIAGAGFVVYKSQNKEVSKTTASNMSPSVSPVVQPSRTVEGGTQYEGMTKYSNDKYGFSFYHPSDWRIEQGELASAVDKEHIELVLWAIDNTVQSTKNKTSYIEVSSRNLASRTTQVDNDIDSNGGHSSEYKKSVTMAGRAAQLYTISQSQTINRFMYFVGNGEKTYFIQTFNEEENTAHSSAYNSNFQKMVDTFKFSQ